MASPWLWSDYWPLRTSPKCLVTSFVQDPTQHRNKVVAVKENDRSCIPHCIDLGAFPMHRPYAARYAIRTMIAWNLGIVHSRSEATQPTLKMDVRRDAGDLIMKTWLSWIATFICLVLASLLVVRSSAEPDAGTQPDSVVRVLSPLVDTIYVRISLADRIALSKWDTRLPIDDEQREQTVLKSAAAQAHENHLDPLRARRFFSDQIEANKLVQYGLLWKWSQNGQAPAGSHPDLIAIRYELDRLQKILLEQLSKFEAYRKDNRCRQWVSSAVANRTQDELHQWALVRATGGLCD